MSTPCQIRYRYNALGQLKGYTDADGNTAGYTYDVDGWLETLNDGKNIQTYYYDPTTGMPTSLTDTVAGTFTAFYDADGNILTENYPNGMKAGYTYDPTGQATSLEYIKTTHCASYKHGAKPESGEPHVEPIALYRSLGETAEGSEVGSSGEGGIGVVPLCKTDAEGECARETGGGGPACPKRFAVCRHYRRRRELSQREAEKVAAEERKLGQDAGCTALGFGVGLAADPVAGAAAGFFCGLL